MLRAWAKAALNRVRSRLVAGERLRLDALETTFADHQKTVAAWATDTDQRKSVLERQVEELRDSNRHLDQQNEILKRWNRELIEAVAGFRQGLDGVREDLGGLKQDVSGLSQSFGGLGEKFVGLSQEMGGVSQDIGKQKRINDDLHRVNEVRTFMDWVPFAPLVKTPLISVIMGTRNRSALLPRAAASVQAQSYPNWELLIVDDGSTDDTPGVLSSLRSDAIRVFRGGGNGVCAARNIALADARGDFIAYLDDDNMMHPHWLKSVAWGFEQWPQSDILYGAFVFDNPARNGDAASGELPYLWFRPYDHQLLPYEGLADISAMAHRNGLPEGRFDETLVGLGDWDLLLRMTRDKPPLRLPAIASFYTTDAPNRLTAGPSFAIERPILQVKNRR